MIEVTHVIPINDSSEHLDSKACGCKPRIEEDGLLVVHNSFDGREKWEQVYELWKAEEITTSRAAEMIPAPHWAVHEAFNQWLGEGR